MGEFFAPQNEVFTSEKAIKDEELTIQKWKYEWI